jgi:arylsulfatase A-like enzyme
MSKRPLIAALLALAGATLAAETRPPPRASVLYILCDDLGYGDVQGLNPGRGRIPTPNLDRLVADGMRFTDAHSGSSVCTPTRYGILTGRYAWRTHLQNGVLMGGSPPLIAADRLTVGALLQQHGYVTACIGKWHVGMTWPEKGGKADFRGPVKDGPTTRGFDTFFGITASLDMPVYAWIENERVTAEPTATKKFLRAGPAAPDFEAVDVLPELTRRAAAWLEARAATNQPFFLYLPLTSPHTPIVPTKEWQGRSGLGDYGDFVMQTDDSVGRVLAALEKSGRAKDTLVLFTSDNGCSPAAHVDQLEAKGHFPSADRRGYKADIWDGGHRVPFIARWPGHIKAGSTSDQVICLTDLLATCAELVGAKLPDDAGEDSLSILPALLSRRSPGEGGREAVVHHSIQGKFAIRQGPWKLELCPGSGGWSEPKDGPARQQGLPAVQLYNLSADVAETNNVQAEHPEIVQKLTALLSRYVADGRSTPGAKQQNDVTVKVRTPDS